MNREERSAYLLAISEKMAERKNEFIEREVAAKARAQRLAVPTMSGSESHFGYTPQIIIVYLDLFMETDYKSQRDARLPSVGQGFPKIAEQINRAAEVASKTVKKFA